MKKHHNLSYLLTKIKVTVYEYFNQDKPWLNKEAVETFEKLLKPTDTMVECGSGRSTAWFAKKVKHLISIEENKEWYEIVKKRLADNNISNVDYRYAQFDLMGEQFDNDFIKTIKSLDDDSIDVCLLDGGPRSFIGLEMMSKLKKGGLLVLDDAQNFMPSQSKSPYAVKSAHEIMTQWNGLPMRYVELYETTKNWQKIWTSDGLKDSVFMYKP
jgi:predicted O-methyltransferase YrrM